MMKYLLTPVIIYILAFYVFPAIERSARGESDGTSILTKIIFAMVYLVVGSLMVMLLFFTGQFILIELGILNP